MPLSTICARERHILTPAMLRLFVEQPASCSSAFVAEWERTFGRALEIGERTIVPIDATTISLLPAGLHARVSMATPRTQEWLDILQPATVPIREGATLEQFLTDQYPLIRGLIMEDFVLSLNWQEHLGATPVSIGMLIDGNDICCPDLLLAGVDAPSRISPVEIKCLLHNSHVGSTKWRRGFTLACRQLEHAHRLLGEHSSRKGYCVIANIETSGNLNISIFEQTL